MNELSLDGEVCVCLFLSVLSVCERVVQCVLALPHVYLFFSDSFFIFYFYFCAYEKKKEGK